MQNKNRPVIYLIRRHAVLALLIFAVTFFLLPFHALIQFNRFANIIRTAVEPLSDEWYNDITREVSNVVSTGNNQEILAFGFAGLGFLSAIILFKHLFSRKQSILIASLPVRRQTDFLQRTAVYLVCSFLPSAICLLLYPLFVQTAGLGLFMNGTPFLQICILLLIHLYGYALGVLSAALTGQIWSCAAIAAFIGMGAEITHVCWHRIATHYLYTLPMDSDMLFIRRFSPAFSLYKTLGRPDRFVPWAGVIAIIVFLILGYVAYTRRQAERTEHPIAFERLELPLALILSLAAGGYIGYVFMTILGTEPALVIALVVGAILAWMLCQVVISLNFRRVFAGMPGGICCAAVLVLCLLVLRFDVFGYDRYMPDPAKLRSVRIETTSGPEYSETYTVKSDNARAAACTLADMLRDNCTIFHTYHDPMYKEYTMTFDGGFIKHVRSYSNIKNAAFAEDPAAWTSAAKTLFESDEYREGIIAESGIDLLLEAIDQGTAQPLNISGWEQLYGNSDSEWDNYKTSAGLPRWIDNLSTDQSKAVLKAARKALLCRTYDTVQQDPVYTLQLSARINTIYTGASLNIYPNETELLTALFGDKGSEMSRLLSGGYAEVTGCIAYKVIYDDIVSQSYSEMPIPVSWQRAESPEQAAEWIRNSVSGSSVEQYTARPVSNEMIWLFYPGSSSDYYLSSIGVEITDETDLVELVIENPGLEYWPLRRNILTQE